MTPNVYIIGYQPAGSTRSRPSPLVAPIQVEELPNGVSQNNVYGVPWIIGAKKDFPAFNRFVMRSDFQITRKLQVSRKKIESYTSANAKDFETNQMIIMAITNHIGFSLWNSYQTNYIPPSGNALTVVVQDKANMVLSNQVKNLPVVYANWPDPRPTNFVAVTPNTFTVWPGAGWDLTKQPSSRGAYIDTASFVTGTFDFPFLPESAYRFATSDFFPTSLNAVYETSASVTPTINPLPQFNLLNTNGIQAYILDGNHIIDYVQFAGPNTIRDLNKEIGDSVPPVNNAPYRMWITNAYGAANSGMI
ncbi:MAG: hypothetical protein JF609_00310, partial [Verrucomicrobia bacterium]|nr:hypothetical protein [Verrucomicrobiota bacterium]